MKIKLLDYLAAIALSLAAGVVVLWFLSEARTLGQWASFTCPLVLVAYAVVRLLWESAKYDK
jgi:hypothetical protein